jgi:hypothetical protein
MLLDASRSEFQLLIAGCFGLQGARMHFISTPAAANKVTPAIIHRNHVSGL